MNKKQENKQENKNARGLFILIIILSVIVGGIIGFCSGFLAHNEGMLDALIQGVSLLERLALPWGTILCTIVLLAFYFPLYGKAKAMFRAWDQEDEAAIESAERRLELFMTIQNLLQILCFFCAGCVLVDFYAMGTKLEWITNACGILGLFLFLVVMVLTQKNAVDLAKEMNPEKKGSVYDMNFTKKWLASCDEAEKMGIYKAAFAAYKSTNFTCMALWLLVCLGSMFLPIGFGALVCVSIIWLSSALGYCLSAMRQSRPSSSACGPSSF